MHIEIVSIVYQRNGIGLITVTGHISPKKDMVGTTATWVVSLDDARPIMDAIIATCPLLLKDDK